MDDKNKEKIIIRIILTIIVIIILLFGLNIFLTKTTTKNFKNYITKNYDTNPKSDIYYAVYDEDNILTKSIKIDKIQNSRVTVSINKKNEIIGKLELFGINKYGNEGISYLKSTYKNNKFDCEFVTNNGYSARCDILKKYSEKFKKETKKIFKKSKTNPFFIKPE